jgi:hypothetical protein
MLFSYLALNLRKKSTKKYSKIKEFITSAMLDENNKQSHSSEIYQVNFVFEKKIKQNLQGAPLFNLIAVHTMNGVATLKYAIQSTDIKDFDMYSLKRFVPLWKFYWINKNIDTLIKYT